MKNQINFDENKILYTNKIVKWIKKFLNEKNFLIISPLTKRSDLFNLKKSSIINKMILDLNEKFYDEIINEKEIITTIDKINKKFNIDLINYKTSYDKFIKFFLEINDEFIEEKELNNILKILNKYSNKIQNIILINWGFELIEYNFNMLNIHILTNNLIYKINWGNLERLVMLDWDIPTEIIDKYKFKSWLELETKMFLTIKDINNYFENKTNMNSFLIDKALKKLKI